MSAPHSSSPEPASPEAGRLLGWIMAALAVWGLFHAVGAWTLNHDLRRSLVVGGCMAAFLGFWAALLVGRRRRRDDGAAKPAARR